MLKNLCIMLTSLLMLLCTVTSASAFRPYIGLKLGPSHLSATGIENTSDTDGAPKADVYKEEVEGWAGLVGASVGFRFFNNNRIEFEYAYRTSIDYDANPTFSNAAVPSNIDSTLQSETFLVNYFREFGQTKVRPFISVSLGMAHNETDTKAYVPSLDLAGSKTRTSEGLAFGFGGGIVAALSEHIEADAGIRYVNLGEAVWGDDDLELKTDNLYTIEGVVAIRYVF